MPIKSRHGGSVSTRRIGANSSVPAARLAPAAHTSPTAHPPQGSRPTRPHTPHTHYPRCPTPAAPTRAHRPSSAVSPVPFLSRLRTCTHRPLSRRFSRAVPLAPSHLHPPSLVPPFLPRLRTCTHRPLSRRFSRACALTARTVLHRMTDPMPRSPAVHPHRPHAAHRPRRTVRARRTVRNRSSLRRSLETAGFQFFAKHFKLYRQFSELK